MTRKKRGVGVQRTEWMSYRHLWTPRQMIRSNNYIYVPPSYAFGSMRDDDPSPKYHRDLSNREKFQPSNLPHRDREKFQRSNLPHGDRMANMIPWLLSMSLMGASQYATHTGPSILSRELQAPALPLTPSVYTPQFSPARTINYKGSISAHDEHFASSKSTAPGNIDNPYGSTPQLRHHVASSNLGRSDYSRPTGRAIDTFHTDPHSVNRLDFHDFGDSFEPGHITDDYVGPAMELVYAWSMIDFEFNNIEERDDAIFKGEYIAENNLPLGLDVWRDKVFITLPKWRAGIPATLSTVPRYSKTKSPKLKPYPNWHWHQSGNCDGLTSVFRVQVDECDRLWVLDSGKTDLAIKSNQVCPPAIYIFDLRNDRLIRKYTLPDEQIKQDSLYINIAVDIRDNDCGSATAYLADVWRYGLVVYDFYKDSAYRIEHHFFYPDPLASRYELHGIKFQWTDGIFGLSLSPVDVHNDRTLYFHPMSSFREFAVSTSIFQDKTVAMRSMEKFMPVGRPRAKDYGHSSGSAIDRNGVMFFNMVTRDSVWCWDTRKEYIPQNLGMIGTSNVSLVFPNDIRIDHEQDQSVWVISNRLPMYLYGTLNNGNINYRVFKANVKEAIRDSVCDPNYVVPDSDPGLDDLC